MPQIALEVILLIPMTNSEYLTCGAFPRAWFYPKHSVCTKLFKIHGNSTWKFIAVAHPCFTDGDTKSEKLSNLFKLYSHQSNGCELELELSSIHLEKEQLNRWYRFKDGQLKLGEGKKGQSTGHCCSYWGWRWGLRLEKQDVLTTDQMPGVGLEGL